MKLRDKETGEIKNVNHAKILIHFNDGETKCVKSLAELNKKYEDYEEPKDFWFIDPEVLIACESTNPLLCDKKVTIETMKQIGNYFETREEAERALEKLKALQRLKDKGISLHLKKQLRVSGVGYALTMYVTLSERSREVVKDLDLLFGGEE